MKRVSLRNRILSTVILSQALMMLVVFLLTTNVFVQKISKLEYKNALENMYRTGEVFRGIQEALEIKSTDWAIWDDTYNYIVDQNQAYAESNLSVSSFSNLQINNVLYFNAQEKSVFRMSLDYRQKVELAFPEDLFEKFTPGSSLFVFSSLEDFNSGIIHTSQGLTFVVARPILTSEGEGPSRGTLVFAKVFDDESLKKMSSAVKLDLKIVSWQESMSLTPSIKTINWHLLAGYFPIVDIYGNPVAALYTEIPRVIFKQTLISSITLFFVLGLMSLIFIGIIYVLINKIFLNRLRLLTQQLSIIGENNNSKFQLDVIGHDELTQVCETINEMLVKIEKSNERIRDAEQRLYVKDHELLLGEQKKVQELENINRIVSERTEELERMQIANLNIMEDLRESKSQAEEASRAKSQFLANMSHEIRTPLNAILGFSHLLQNANLTDEQRSQLGMVLSSGELLATIINDILDISKAESGKMTLESIDFKLSDCCQDAFNIASQKRVGKDIIIDHEISSDIPQWVKGDPTRLKQVIVNLLTNALKFTEQGTVRLLVKREPELDNHGRVGVRFEVHDTGIGIPDEKIGQLFQLFYQTDTSTTRKFGGTGLGLAICKSLVELMGGKIWVESRVGGGSKFIFKLNFYPGVHTSNESETIQKEADLSKIRVLVVEDSKPNQELMKAYFKILGVNADYAENGQEAFELLRRDSRYDIVLMDMQMPVMGGCEATELIHREINKDLKIVALTAAATKEDQQKCLTSGMIDFLTKPIQVTRLKDALIKYAIQGFSRGSPEQVSASPTTPRQSGMFDLARELGLEPAEYSELLTSVIDSFALEEPKFLIAIEKSDYATLKLLAHRFKGTFSNFRLIEISSFMREMEIQAENKSSEAILKGLFLAVKDKLDQLRRSA